MRYVSEPYRGDTIDGPENGQPPRPWQMSCQKDQMFVDRVAEMEVPHTATIQVRRFLLLVLLPFPYLGSAHRIFDLHC